MPDAFLIVWDQTDVQNQVHRVESYDWHVAGTEVRDPEEAAEKVARTHPDAVVLWLDSGYPASRRAALRMKTQAETEHMPLVFVNGSYEDQGKMKQVFPGAIYTDTYQLEHALKEAQKQAKKAGKEAERLGERSDYDAQGHQDGDHKIQAGHEGGRDEGQAAASGS